METATIEKPQETRPTYYKKRRDSSRWYIRIQSRVHHKSIIQKSVVVVFLTAFILYIRTFQLLDSFMCGMLWSVFFIAIVMPGNKKDS